MQWNPIVVSISTRACLETVTVIRAEAPGFRVELLENTAEGYTGSGQGSHDQLVIFSPRQTLLFPMVWDKITVIAEVRHWPPASWEQSVSGWMREGTDCTSQGRKRFLQCPLCSVWLLQEQVASGKYGIAIVPIWSHVNLDFLYSDGYRSNVHNTYIAVLFAVHNNHWTHVSFEF